MKQHFALLGYEVKDTVTGFKGIVSTIAFDLYGCVQAVVTPGMNAEGKLGEAAWFDLKRLVPVSKEPVMATPTFEMVPGGQPKPPLPSNPIR